MYKTVVVIYIVSFFCYVLFSRVPDYFDGDFIQGVVAKAGFSSAENRPELVVNYRVGDETFKYITNGWFLTSYKKGQSVTIIYNSSNPSIACMYAFIGYWIQWPELIFTAAFFIILFLAAVFITGNNSAESRTGKEQEKKRKYDE